MRAAELDALTCHEDTGTSYLNLGDISDGHVNDDLPNLKSLDPKMAKYCIHDGDVLLSKTGVPFKVAVAEVPEGRRILANGNLYVISVDKDKVDPPLPSGIPRQPHRQGTPSSDNRRYHDSQHPHKIFVDLQVPMTDMKHQKKSEPPTYRRLTKSRSSNCAYSKHDKKLTDLFEG